jgi:hypothetical protein
MHNSGFFWGAVHPLPYVFMGWCIIKHWE